MAKRVKSRKGSICKKALAAILAASMVLSSSAFSVLAGPNEDNGIMTIAQVQNVYVDVGANLVYNGKEQELPNLAVYDNKTTSPESKDSGAVLIPREYYDVEYFNNKNVGTGFVTITFKDAYAATEKVTAEFTIDPLTVDGTAKVEYEAYNGLTYNGQPQTPKIKSVTVGNVVLNADDYKLVDAGAASDKFIAAGDHKVKLAAGDSGNITVAGNVGEFDYVITKAPFSKSTVNVTTQPAIYTGSAITEEQITKSVKVTDLEGKPMTLEGELGNSANGYTIVYYDKGNRRMTEAPTDVGTYKIVLKRTDAQAAALGSNYKAGELESTLEIQYSNLQVQIDEKLAANESLGSKGPEKGNDGKLTYTYDMNSHCPDTSEIDTFLTTGKNALSKNDYSLDMSNAAGTNVGDYEVVINGKNGLDGKTARIPYSIVPYAFDATSGGVDVSDTPNYQPGTRIEATAIAGTAAGNVKTTVTVKDKGKQNDATDDKELVKGVDYDVTVGSPYVKSINGKATKVIDITVNAKGNYKNKVVNGKEEPLKLRAIVSDKISLSDESITAEVTGTHSYNNGIQVTPLENEIVVQDTNRGVRLEKDIDFTVTYGPNNKAGKDAGTITITAKESRYYETGTQKTIKFDIVGTDVATRYEIAPVEAKKITNEEGDNVDLLEAAESLTYLYKGTSNEVDSTTIEKTLDTGNAKYYKDGRSIDKDTIKNIKESCVITVEVPANGTSGYTGSLKVDYVINGKDVTEDVSVDDIPDQNYTGSEIKPAITVFKSSTRLIEGTDFDLYFDNNVNVGTAYVRVVLKGKYSGTIIKTFKIVGGTGTLQFADPAQKSLLENGVAVGAEDLTLNIVPSAEDDTLKLSYASDNTDVVTVTEAGVLSFKGEGTATVTVTATSSKASYEPLKVTVVVKKDGTPTEELVANCTPSRLKKVKNSFTVTTSTVKGADKWVIRYSLKNLNKTTKGSAKATFEDVNKVIRQVVKVNKSGTKYYVQCRVVKDGVKSAWSKVKTVKSR